MNTRIREEIKIEDLVDIKDVVINPALNKEERIESFISQIKNPLCYKCGDYIVYASFSDDDCTLDECYAEYIINCEAEEARAKEAKAKEAKAKEADKFDEVGESDFL